MRVVTLNLGNYNDVAHWEQRSQRIAGALIDLEADVVGLQEVRFDPDQISTRESYQNMAEQVLRTIRETTGGEAWAGTKLVSQPAMYYPTVEGGENPWEYPQLAEGDLDRQWWEGLSLLSRSPVGETGSRFLSRGSDCTDANRRIVQQSATGELDTQVYVFNTHFALTEACRAANVDETLAYMSRSSGDQLLVGDLNATPDDPTLEPLREAGLVDLWQELHPDAAGHTYPSDAPAKRIDYCWASPDLAARAIAIELILTEPDPDGVYASDHLGLCVTFEVES